ncbi:hypothetical protein [Neisseria blantyrii]|uniref:hypothetical protein n=1 Tax=Neisseria blantyrii TaxID=2830647 RepID=UPI0026588F96|nr:hypothetical protein [Neisseria blantyrii]
MPVIPTPNRSVNPHVSVAVWSASKLNVIWEKSAAATPVQKANASPSKQMVKSVKTLAKAGF